MPLFKSQLIERPLPELSATVHRLCLANLVVEAKYADQVKNFYKGLEKILVPAQSDLETHADDWQNMAMTRFYLEGRKSLAFYSNVFYLMEKSSKYPDCLSRACHMIQRALSFRERVQSNSLPCEREAGYLLDQSFYPAFFGSTRLPNPKCDHLLQRPDRSHIIIACRGYLHLVQGGHFNTSMEAWFQVLKKIVNHSPINNTYAPALWTSLDRHSWAEIRGILQTDPTHRRAIDLIESAALWVALEVDESPKTHAEALRILAFDRALNRWYDKSHQLVIYGNGISGINRDHTLLDGHPTRLYLEYLQQDQGKVEECSGNDLKWEPLNLALMPSLSQRYYETEKKWEKHKNNFSITVWDHHALGQRRLKSLDRHGDFLVQAAIHTAAQKTFGHLVPITESVHMRHTYGGRYDSILPLTPEMLNFIEHLSIQCPNHRLFEIYLKAEESHRLLIKECKKGNSPLLHLTALLQRLKPGVLEQLLQEHDGKASLDIDSKNPCNPPFWTPDFFRQLLAPKVTSSGPGYCPGFEMSGFTDTLEETIGISYLVKPDRISFYLKADGKSGAKAPLLKKNLTKFLDDFVDLISGER